MKSILILPAIISFLFFGNQQKKVIQFDVAALLNARPVTTLTKGKLISWTKGIDGNGIGDGYLTQSAAAANGDKEAHALPNDPLIPANNKHPELLLHYINSDAKNYQARFVSGAGKFTLPVPVNRYKTIFLGLSSAEGSSSLDYELLYTNGSVAKHYLLPDYYNNVDANDSSITYLCTDLAKWDNQNVMKEKDHHNIHLLIIHVDASRNLKAISLKKRKEGYLIFWCAAGELQ